MKAPTPIAGRLLVVQPSADYAERVRRNAPQAMFLASPERAAALNGHPVTVADLSDFISAMRLVRKAVTSGELGIDGITCFVCEHLQLTAAIAENLGLPYYAAESVRVSRDKAASIRLWREAGLTVPASAAIESLQDLLDFARRYPAPWILKPIDRSGSEWVLRVERSQDLSAAHQRIVSGISAGEATGQQIRYLAQTCIQGRELSADLFLDGSSGARVMRWTEKYLIETPGQAGLVGAYFPARLTPRARGDLTSQMASAAAALGVRRGLVMVDGILSPGGFHLLEMGLRPGGDCLPDLGFLTTGYDPIRAACLTALGEATEPRRGRTERIAALHLMANFSGAISHLDLEAVSRHPAVLKVEAYRGLGQRVRVWAGSYDDRIVAACLARFNRVAELPGLLRELGERMQLRTHAAQIKRRA